MSFKTCPFCKHIWESREGFLRDPEVTIIGYQPDIAHSSGDIFLFNHACKTTMSVPASAFLDLYKGPVSDHDNFKGEGCQGYCTRLDDFHTCSANCKRAHVRQIVLAIHERLF